MTGERTVVAYKGGHVGKDLKKMNIPCLDLQTWGCRKYEQLKQTIVDPLASSPLSHNRVSRVLVLVQKFHCKTYNDLLNRLKKFFFSLITAVREM